MPGRLFKLLDSKDTHNGTRALLEEIRIHQKDMPAEVVDDVTFGALVVLYDMGQTRGKRLKNLEKCSVVYSLMLFGIGVIMFALHADVPRLSGLLEQIFGA